MKKKSFYLLLFLLFVIFIFRNWFLSDVVSSGDLRVFYQSTFKDYFLYPYAWDWNLQNGMGGFGSAFGWLTYDLNIPLFIGRIFHLDWPTIERIFFVIPFLCLSIISSLYFFKTLFPRNPFFLLASVIYLLNTYILMMVGGGQIVGISFAYAFFPLVLLQFMFLFTAKSRSQSFFGALVAGVCFALLIFFDLRFAYIAALVALLYFFFTIRYSWRKSIVFCLSFVVAGLLHAFWIVPVLINHQNPAQALGSAYSSLQSVSYFSFATFENSISLLHPNWPENIFGKVGFMKPEFLILPLLAYSSLLFISKSKKQENKLLLFFALLGLFGSFLAKGANDPFGFIYLWLFDHIPGFVMFRDPTKWYVLVAISYSVLIPFSIWEIYEWLESKVKSQKSKVQFKIKRFIQNLFIVLTTLYLIFLIRPALFGQLGGTFQPTTIPSEYLMFEQFLSNQSHFFRTLWIPVTQSFSYSSMNHPAIPAQGFFEIYNKKQLLKKLSQKETEKVLQGSGIQYIIVPFDSEKNIFLDDRKYSQKLHDQVLNQVRKIPWIHQINTFGELAVFKVDGAKDRFWSPNKNLHVVYTYINPTKYLITVQNAKQGDLIIFSESFDSHWVAQNSEFTIQSSAFNKRFNSFVLPNDGDYTLEIVYTLQKWVEVGLWISGTTIVLVIGSLLFLKKR